MNYRYENATEKSNFMANSADVCLTELIRDSPSLTRQFNEFIAKKSLTNVMESVIVNGVGRRRQLGARPPGDTMNVVARIKNNPKIFAANLRKKMTNGYPPESTFVQQVESHTDDELIEKYLEHFKIKE